MKNLLLILFFSFSLSMLNAQLQPGLHVDENFTVLFGKDTTSHGELKFMWLPSKGALRAGLAYSAWNYSAIGNVSTAFGSDTHASGNYSFATGLGTAANSYTEFSIGLNSLAGGSHSAWVLTDPIFEIGNGPTSGSKSNLFTVLKNGNVKIGTMSSPTEEIGERLLVDGGIVLANSIDPTPSNGTIRYNGDFQGYMGGAWSSLTNGGVGSTLWNQNSNNIYYTAGNIGIGTSSPNSRLHINATNTNASTPAARIQVSGSTKFTVNQNGGITIGTNDPDGSPDNGLFVSGDGRFFSDVIIGAFTTKATGYKLSVDGKIISEEVRVQNSGSWPDYVFAEDYDLQSIESLEQSILKNHHLPGIPSAKEVEAEGILLGDMQKRMIEKIEELVLYTIQQEKRIKTLEKLLLDK